MVLGKVCIAKCLSPLDGHGTFLTALKGYTCLSSYKGETDLIRHHGLCSAVPNPDFTSLSELECRGKVAGRRLHAGTAAQVDLGPRT